jgi:hypothetical protein
MFSLTVPENLLLDTTKVLRLLSSVICTAQHSTAQRSFPYTTLLMLRCGAAHKEGEQFTQISPAQTCSTSTALQMMQSRAQPTPPAQPRALLTWLGIPPVRRLLLMSKCSRMRAAVSFSGNLPLNMLLPALYVASSSHSVLAGRLPLNLFWLMSSCTRLPQVSTPFASPCSLLPRTLSSSRLLLSAGCKQHVRRHTDTGMST